MAPVRGADLHSSDAPAAPRPAPVPGGKETAAISSAGADIPPSEESVEKSVNAAAGGTVAAAPRVQKRDRFLCGRLLPPDNSELDLARKRELELERKRFEEQNRAEKERMNLALDELDKRRREKAEGASIRNANEQEQRNEENLKRLLLEEEANEKKNSRAAGASSSSAAAGAPVINDHEKNKPTSTKNACKNVPYNIGAWVQFLDLVLDRFWYCKYWDPEAAEEAKDKTGRDAIQPMLRQLLEEGAKVFCPYFQQHGEVPDCSEGQSSNGCLDGDRPTVTPELIERALSEWIANEKHCFRDGRLDRTSLHTKRRLNEEGVTFADRLYGISVSFWATSPELFDEVFRDDRVRVLDGEVLHRRMWEATDAENERKGEKKRKAKGPALWPVPKAIGQTTKVGVG